MAFHRYFLQRLQSRGAPKIGGDAFLGMEEASESNPLVFRMGAHKHSTTDHLLKALLVLKSKGIPLESGLLGRHRA